LECRDRKRLGKSGGDSRDTLRAAWNPKNPAQAVCHGAVIEKTSPAHLLSHSNNSFLVSTHFPFSDSENLSYNTLIDSGATHSFIDKNLAEKFPKNISDLDTPIPLELFNGQPTSAGDITKIFKDTISFADSSIQTVEFLITQLHPTAPIVLGLPWLKEFNPEINWKDLTLTFQGREQISASLVDSFTGTWNLNTSEKQDTSIPDSQHKSAYNEQENVDVDLSVLEFNEWLLYTNWANDYDKDLEKWKNKYNIGDNGNGYSEKALKAWAERIDKRSSKLPAYKQKRRWIYKRVRKLHQDSIPQGLSTRVLNISKTSALQQWRKCMKRGMKIGKPEKVERRMGPNLPGKAVSLISAAAMDTII